MQQNVAAAQTYVNSADLRSSYDRVQEVVLDAQEKNLSRNRDIRGPLAELVATLERRAMEEFTAAQEQYFAGEETAALERFASLTELSGLQAAREAAGELRKEDDRAEWRTLRDTVTAQFDSAAFADAQPTLRDLTRLARRTGYDAVTDELLATFAQTAQQHIDTAKQAIDAEDYDNAYGVLFEVSRLNDLRAQANAARQLLREHAAEPGMRQAQREYEATDALAEIREDLAEADGRTVDRVRQQAQRKLEQLASQYEGTRAADEAKALADELGEQLAAG